MSVAVLETKGIKQIQSVKPACSVQSVKSSVRTRNVKASVGLTGRKVESCQVGLVKSLPARYSSDCGVAHSENKRIGWFEIIAGYGFSLMCLVSFAAILIGFFSVSNAPIVG